VFLQFEITDSFFAVKYSFFGLIYTVF
jgi:hypothetical protein